jgi:3-methylcrotonyl-CoA carboxylase alpha subunit
MPKLERSYLWNGARRKVHAQIDGDRLYIELDGKPAKFTIVPGPAGAFVLQDQDRVVTGYAVASGQSVWVQVGGRTYVLETEQPAKAKSGAAGPTGGDVISPMTGTVRKVFVRDGQAVQNGTPLLVVEAMKMEFTVTAPGEGRVAQVLCSVGESVDLGQILVHFEPVDTNGTAAGES